jgi:hypothetical protein
MKKPLLAAFAFLGFALAVYASFSVSRLYAERKADSIMKPVFAEGWFRKQTTFVFLPKHYFSPEWLIEYGNDRGPGIIDFGPQFQITFLGKIVETAPKDLIAQIKTKRNAVEQGAAANP